jgi:molecular chaperone GrpE (heat shock protein)
VSVSHNKDKSELSQKRDEHDSWKAISDQQDKVREGLIELAKKLKWENERLLTALQAIANYRAHKDAAIEMKKLAQEACRKRGEE